MRGSTRVGGAAAAVLVALVGACGGGSETTPVQEIVADPQRFYGEEVTVESTVSRELDHRVWEMADGRLFAIRDERVVPYPRNGERLRLAGTVHPLERQTIEGELGIDIEDHFFTDDFLADDVVLVVETLERVER